MKPIVIDLRSRHHLVQKVTPHCPGCNAGVDGATGGIGALPAPGNISVCVYCATVGVYEPVSGGMTLREMSGDELDQLPQDIRLKILFLQQSIKQFLAEKKK